MDLTPLTVTEIRWPASFVPFGGRLEYHTPPESARNISVQITFSEDVTDFEPEDIQLLGTATVAEVDSVESVNGSSSKYTLTLSVTPTTDGTGDGTLGIHIPGGAVQDVSSGNDNIAYSTGDNAAAILFSPTLEMVVPEEPQNGAFDVVFEFNEPVTGLTRNWVNNYFRSAMNPIGGTLTDWNENATGTTYTATITPTRDGVFPIFRFAANQVLAENTDGLKILIPVYSPRAVTIVVPNVITDPVLAVAIRETLGLLADTRILAETLEDLVSLNVQVGGIDTLAGLEHATHLTTLSIDAGSITDITPLQTLTQLTTLKMNGGAITDVTPLQTLTALTILELQWQYNHRTSLRSLD